MNINFQKKSYRFKLCKKVNSSRNNISYKKGWIIRLKNENNILGFGEISPLKKQCLNLCEKQINIIPSKIDKKNLIQKIETLHPCVQSGINSALAEIEGIFQFKKSNNFEGINETAILANSKNILEELIYLQEKYNNKFLTIKWKVAIQDNKIEEKILEKILSQIKGNIKLRIDANGSWNSKIANRWADILKDNKNLDWIEQPLSVDDIKGHILLEKKIPVALDESLIKYPDLIKTWAGWQIRRPSQEKNPIKLFNELNNKKGLRSISTSFETGIGQRILFHFASIQLMGPSPKVPGLALKYFPESFLFSNNPNKIWENL